jgi:preprotein translocase subunit YajC
VGKKNNLKLQLYTLSFLILSPSLALAFTESYSKFIYSINKFIPLLLIFSFFYIFLLRPQQKKIKKHQNLLKNLEKDDRIITAGGLYATIISVNNDTIEIKISKGVHVILAKQAVSSIIKQKKIINTTITKLTTKDQKK